MSRFKNLTTALILLLTVFYNLKLYFPETRIQADPNDNIFQYALVVRTNWVWENYGCPLSLSCLPNLIDHNVTYWAEGYPLPFYYSHLPQIAIVSSYNLLVKPLASFINPDFSLYAYYNFGKYLLLCFFPVFVYLALRVAGFKALPSALASFLAAHFSTDGLYGIDPPSFLWRGWGLTSQLYAMTFMPLALAFSYRAITKFSKQAGKTGDALFSAGKFINRFTIGAIIFTSITTAGHLGMGMMTLLSMPIFLLRDTDRKNFLSRLIALAFIATGTIFLLSYWIVPMLLNNNYHMISFWDPIWKFDSYGWYEVTRQFLQGEIFDWKRFPYITLLVFTGFFAAAVKTKKFTFSLLFAFWSLMYFGRTTWGSFIDLIPGMKDFHLHRYVVAVQISALFLLPEAITYLWDRLDNFLSKVFSPKTAKLIRRIYYYSLKLKIKEGQKPVLLNNILIPARYLTLTVIFILLSYHAGSNIIKQTEDYANFNNTWIDEANKAFNNSVADFEATIEHVRSLDPARVYAGRPGNWGKDFKLGSTAIYMIVSVYGIDSSQFLPETWSPMSENDQNFDERVARDYDLLNLRYIIADKDYSFPDTAEVVFEKGPYKLFEMPTNGWFDIVTPVMSVESDKTNFINIVHFWHRSYARLWKMHPFISVERNPEFPPNLQRNIKMIDEVSYLENGEEKNIWADFPFAFPQSTPSGVIKSENVEKQSFKADLIVPEDCENCHIMFKMSYHPNWQAKLDGKKVKAVSVFPFYLAVPAETGEHTLEFSYKPSGLKLAILALEIFTLLGIISYVIGKKLIK